MKQSDKQFELLTRKQENENFDDKMDQAVTKFKWKVLENQKEAEEGNKHLPNIETQGNSIRDKLTRANNAMNQMLHQTSDWTIYYVLIIEFFLFILLLFL